MGKYRHTRPICNKHMVQRVFQTSATVSFRVHVQQVSTSINKCNFTIKFGTCGALVVSKWWQTICAMHRHTAMKSAMSATASIFDLCEIGSSVRFGTWRSWNPMEPASDTIFLCSVLRVSVHTARTAQLRSQLSASRSRKSAHTFRKWY